MLDAALNQLDMGILIVDINNTIVFVNALCEKYLGIKKEEALHQNMDDFFQAKFNHTPELSIVLSTKKQLIKEIVPYDGRYYKAVMKPLIKNGEVIGAIGELYDITGHILEQRKLRQAIQNMDAGIVPIMSDLGVLPLRPITEINYGDEHTFTLDKILKSCLEMKIEYLIIDLTAITYTSEMCVSFLNQLRDNLQLIGIQIAFTGIRSDVASALVNIGASFGETKIFAKLSQAVEWFRVKRELAI